MFSRPIPLFLILGSFACAVSATTEPANTTSKERTLPTAVQAVDPSLLAPVQSAEDKRFIEAQTAYQQNRLETLESIIPDISPDHPLRSYLTLWSLHLQLRANRDNPTVNAAFIDFIDAHRGEYLGERAASDYLLTVGDSINPALFNRLYDGLRWNKTEAPLLAWHYYYNFERTPLSKIQLFLRDTRLSGTPLQKLLDKILDRHPDWTWNALVILLQKERYREVRRLIETQPQSQLPASKTTLRAFLNNPVRWMNRHGARLQKMPARLGIFVTLRLVHSHPKLAEQASQKVIRRLSRDWQNLIWGVQGYAAIVAQSEGAADYFRKAGNGLFKNTHLVTPSNVMTWAARAYLRDGDWKNVASVTALLPAPLRHDEIWVYWRARALSAIGQKAQAQTLYRSIASHISFYGKLACNELEVLARYEVNDPAQSVSAKELTRWEKDPSLRRARAFYRMELYGLGHREWNWAQSGVRGKLLLALAAYAEQHHLTYRMINTSERTGSALVSMSQRYPTPGAGLIERAAAEQDVSAAWVFGLIRQESRFMPAVSSAVGARGLMQIMPGTADWTARKIGMDDYTHSRLTDLETNTRIGTAYLKMLETAFDGSKVLATAAYNAGPARARLWRNALKAPMEAAVFIECIPFYETRDYVKNVMANTQTYGMRFGLTMPLFKDMLGKVAPGESSSAASLP